MSGSLPTLSASGIDTVSYAWRPDDTAVLDAFMRRPHRVSGRGYVLEDRGPGDERVLMYPSNGVLAVEGRLGAILDGNPDSYDLMPAHFASQGERQAGQVVHALTGSRPRGTVEVRRYDLAAEVSFEDPIDGRVFLNTLAGCCPPRLKANIISATGDPSTVETVYFRTPKRHEVRSRFYDKGVESGSHPRGLRVRLEAQMRPDKADRRTPDNLAEAPLHVEFGRTMVPYLGAGELVAAGPTGAVEHLAEQVARGEIGMARAERLVGTVAMLSTFGRAIYSERQGQRRLADLRGAGVSLQDTLPADRVLPVGQLLRDAIVEFAP